MTELALKLVETDEVANRALSISELANAIKITDLKTYEEAGFMWKALGDMLKEIDEKCDKNISLWHNGHKNAVAEKKKYYEPVEAAKRYVKGIMSNYEQEQERIRLAEQKRLEEEARKAEEERRLLEAIQAEEEAKANGLTEQEAAQEAEAIINEPVYVAPVILPKETPKVKGLSFRTVWKFRITNESAIPRQYLMPNEKAIGGVIRNSQGKIRIAGVEPYEERV